MYRILYVLVIVALLASCGEKAEEIKEAVDATEELSNAQEEIEKSQQTAEEIRQERIARGDTNVIHFKELEKYLPQEIDGFTANTPDGQTIDQMGLKISHVHRTYDSEDGKTITIDLYDYLMAQENFNAAIQTISMVSIETEDEIQKGFDTGIPNVTAFERFNKVDGEAQTVYGIAYRFILLVSVTNQEGTDFAKEIGKKIDLKKLANK